MGNELRQVSRQRVSYSRPCWMNVISFKKMTSKDLIVKVVDTSPQGVGIEASHKVEPGFVWFPEEVDGHRGGLLMWSKKVDSVYRGGIKFVSLSPEHERIIEEIFAEDGPLKDPLAVAETMLESYRKSGGGYIVKAESELDD
jgi:hypothetical protein